MMTGFLAIPKEKPMPDFAPFSELADKSKNPREGTLARIDVVIPCYNYGRFLYQCVNSVLDQAGGRRARIGHRRCVARQHGGGCSGPGTCRPEGNCYLPHY